MNICVFVGKLVANPELTTTKDSYVVNFTLAVEDYRKDKDGTKHRKVHFLDFEAWDTGATTIAKHFKKGDMLFIESEARQHKWISADQSKKQKIVFRVKTFKSGMKSDSNLTQEQE
jgi:single stranded DNA-binding protein